MPGRLRARAGAVALTVCALLVALELPSSAGPGAGSQRTTTLPVVVAPTASTPPRVGGGIRVDRALPPLSSPRTADAPDPEIVHHDGWYWLYSTQVWLLNVPVHRSRDLVSWEAQHDALPTLPAWASWGRTWAPGVVRVRDGWALYFAARHTASGRQCIGVATASTPRGPFRPTSGAPLVCQLHLGGSIDPSPFVAADGTLHLLWKSDENAIGRASRIWSQQLSADGTRLVGSVRELLHHDRVWEQPLIENPEMVRAPSGQHYLFYSANWWESTGYATGYATCAGPAGPCHKVTTAGPWFAADHTVAGPGGATVVRAPEGTYFLAYHGWEPGRVGYRHGGARAVRFAELDLSGAAPTVVR